MIVDFALTERDIAGFQEAVSTFQEFQSVPLLIVGCQVNRENFKQVASIRGVDDMVASGISAEQLYAKIKFLKKIRMMNRKSMTERPALQGGKQIKQAGFFLKKMLDIIVSFSALAVLSPFFLLIAIAIKLESKGPIFYISPRAGNGYRIFRFYKFRTMVVNADKKLKEVSHLNQYDSNAGTGPVFIKVSHDPRVTKIGAFLRNTSIDELPQLINVLKGNMSLVGNRPLPLYEASTLTTDQWVERFLAPAGITGLWQVTKRGKKEMSVDERISLDIDYAHKSSFLYDLSILWNTPLALVQKEDV